MFRALELKAIRAHHLTENSVRIYDHMLIFSAGF